MVVGSDEIKARLKKFESHTRAISKLVRENISDTINAAICQLKKLSVCQLDTRINVVDCHSIQYLEPT